MMTNALPADNLAAPPAGVQFNSPYFNPQQGFNPAYINQIPLVGVFLVGVLQTCLTNIRC